MNDRSFDLLLWLIGTTLIGWGAYEIYTPAAKIVVGMAILGLVGMARGNQ